MMSPHAIQQIHVARGDVPPDLSSFGGKYMSVTTFRRNGSRVATPVWFVRDFDRLLVQTDEGSGKVRRLRQKNPLISRRADRDTKGCCTLA